MADEMPRIQIDDDWKQQAQAEKERLAAETEAAGDEAAMGPMPEAGFGALVNMIAAQALLYMGAIPVSQDGKTLMNLDMAKHQIDTLQILEEKTKGNLTDEEKSVLNRSLYELRMRFLQLSRGA